MLWCTVAVAMGPQAPPFLLSPSAALLQAVKAAKAAEVEVSKLNYRILHLTRSLRAASQ